VILVLGSKFTSTEVITWTEITIISFAWIAINFIYDLILRKNNSQNRSWFTSPMKLADWRFALFLLLMSGFWTAFNQIFYTLPLYIRDFTDTSDLFFFLQSTLEGIGLDSWAASLNAGMVTENQLNPEYIININAGGIVLFQVIVSYFVTRLKPFTTIFWGTVITIFSFIILIFGTTGWIVAAGILVFSFGEMMASPKQKEYTGRIAPPNKVALYMGYFYWAVALGNLFGGILSGQLYAAFARDMQRPDIMWAIFAALAALTALLVFLYDKFVIRRSS
jgi:dipeptide/tripeptide permease